MQNSTAEKTSQPSALRRTANKILLLVAAILILLGWLLTTPQGLLGKADAVGYAVCHRISARSFHLGERTLPLCARCTGMFLGAFLGLAYQFLLRKKHSNMPPKWMYIFFGLIVISFGVDGINSYLVLMKEQSQIALQNGLPINPATIFHTYTPIYNPNNILRLLTGTGLGVVIAIVLYPAFNGTILSKPIESPAFKNWKDLAALFGTAVLLDMLVLTENIFILYPLALASTFGVLAILTMAYSLVWLFIFKAENEFDRLRNAWPALLGGFTFALLQIALMDLGRYFLTGTWEGFDVFFH
jgi:uncharacterized membrane protein